MLSDSTVRLYVYIAEPVSNIFGICLSILFALIYIKYVRHLNWLPDRFRVAANALHPITVKILLIFLVSEYMIYLPASMSYNLFYLEYDDRADNCENLIISFSYTMKYISNTNIVISVLVLALVGLPVVLWSFYQNKGTDDGRVETNNINKRNIMWRAMAMVSMCLVHIIGFTLNIIKDKTEETAEDDSGDWSAEDDSGDWCEIYLDFSILSRFNLPILSWSISFLAVFIFTLYIATHYDDIKQKKREKKGSFKAQSIYHDLDRPFHEVLAMLSSQCLLVTIYTSSVGELSFDPSFQTNLDHMFYFTTIVVVSSYIAQVNVEEKKESCKFWANVLAHRPWQNAGANLHGKYLKTLLQSMSVFLRFIGDMYINVLAPAYILTVLPLQAATGNNGNPIEFVLNLVAVFYVFALDDIPESKQTTITIPYSLPAVDEQSEHEGANE